MFKPCALTHPARTFLNSSALRPFSSTPVAPFGLNTGRLNTTACVLPATACTALKQSSRATISTCEVSTPLRFSHASQLLMTRSYPLLTNVRMTGWLEGPAAFLAAAARSPSAGLASSQAGRPATQHDKKTVGLRCSCRGHHAAPPCTRCCTCRSLRAAVLDRPVCGGSVRTLSAEDTRSSASSRSLLRGRTYIQFSCFWISPLKRRLTQR